MAFTFELSSGERAVYRLSQLRLLVGDSVENDGPRPKQGNYDDMELGAFLELEGDGLSRAAARTFEALAAEWSRYAGSYRLGPESEEARQSVEFAARAKALRELHGFAIDDEGSETAATDSGYVDWSDAVTDWMGKF